MMTETAAQRTSRAITSAGAEERRPPLFIAHVINVVIAIAVLATSGGAVLPLGALRTLYCTSLIIVAMVVWEKRTNALFEARTVILLLPGYFAAGVQLWNPSLYYSSYEAVSQTLDISMTMYALSSLALAGSEVGLWLGKKAVSQGDTRDAALRQDFYFYAAVIPLLAVSYYVSLTYGDSLFTASYATGGMAGAIGSANAIGGVLTFMMFENATARPSAVKRILFLASAFMFLIFGMLIRGGRQDVLSCLFGLYVINWGQKRRGAPISLGAVALGCVGFVAMEYLGFIRGSILSANFDYIGNFRDFIYYYLHPHEVINFSTVSPIASTFGNTIYALRTSLTGHLWGRGYYEYILRTPPEFLYPDRPRDYAWIMLDWNLKAGGGFFELAEAYLNLGAVGVLIVPMIISYFFSRVFYGYVRRGGVWNSFLLFGLLSVFLRGALYQTFAYYKAVLASCLLMAAFTFACSLFGRGGRGTSAAKSGARKR